MLFFVLQQRYCSREYIGAKNTKHGICASSSSSCVSGCNKSVSQKTKTEKQPSEVSNAYGGLSMIILFGCC